MKTSLIAWLTHFKNNMADIKTAIEYARQNPNSPFATELRGRIQSGRMNEELSNAGLSNPMNPPKDEGFVADLKGIASGIKESAIKRSDNFGEIDESVATGETTKARSLLQKFGQGAGFASDIIGETIMGGIKALTPQKVQEKVGSAVQTGAEKVADTETAQRVIGWYSGLDESSKKDVDALLGTLSLATDVVGGAIVKKPLQEGAEATIKAVGNTIDNVVDTTTDVMKTAKGAVDTVKNIADPITSVPRRVATNVATKMDAEKAIKELPSKIAQRAVRDDIDIVDVKNLYTIPKEQGPALKKLAENVKQFEVGATKSNPLEAVGKPIVNRLKELDAKRSEVGKKLGSIADGLGDVNQIELEPVVLSKLQDLGGMDGLRLSKSGELDFSNTNLASELSKSDQVAIQKAFTEAVKDGSGKSKHLLRQELFEILGGKKKSLANITDTQERAYEAIRSALSDVLDTKNDSYKALNSEYRQIVTPLNEMRKFMKGLEGADEDILEMSAGLLARRLASNSATNPRLQLILRNLDNATKVKGKSSLQTKELIDFYNILEKYYDIAPKAGFQGQITAGIEKAGNLQGVIMDKLKDVAGRSNPVRQKALEDLLEELFGTVKKK